MGSTVKEMGRFSGSEPLSLTENDSPRVRVSLLGRLVTTGIELSIRRHLRSKSIASNNKEAKQTNRQTGGQLERLLDRRVRVQDEVHPKL